MPAFEFTPPGHLDELSANGRKLWNEFLDKELEDARRGDGNPTDSPRAQFFNPKRTPIAEDAATKPIFWTASPRTLRFETASDSERWEIADNNRDRQDEYCEWVVRRNEKEEITRVTFTCEVPEYFTVLARDQPQRLLDFYHEFVSRDVKPDELVFPNGAYNPRNDWNLSIEKGPAHLSQVNNTLHAAVELAGAATIPRFINGRLLTAEQELIRCGGYGEAKRNSDPHIGASVNALARETADVTLADPPGLYISDFTPAGWETPDGTDPKEFWRYERGVKGHRLRGVYEVRDRDYVVSDIKIRGEPIVRGAQIADFVSVKVTGLACRFGKSRAEPFTVCKR